MKFRSRSLLATAIAFASQGAFSADTFLNVFLESTPMKGLEVRLDGKVIGSTDERGAASSYTPAGEHKIQLYRDGVFIADIDYTTLEDQDAEISVTFTPERSKPEITISVYDPSDSSVMGVVSGIISDRDDNPIFGATVSDLDGTASAETDQDGVYELTVPRGTRTLRVSHPNYSAKIVNDITVLSNVGNAVSVKLPPSVDKSEISVAVPAFEPPIEEVVTLGTYKASNSSLGLERFSENVIDAIDVETMARFGDGNIASALTRLAGVAVTGGQYANVRGLDGRYISSTLNGFLMPSTDPLRRDIQLDLFPAGIVDGIEVQKSFSPDLYATTTGGTIGIKTKGLPDERIGSVNVSIGGNGSVTGDDILTYRSSSTDWLTYDSGLRTLSQDVLDVTDQGTSINISDSGQDGVVSPQVAAVYAVTFEDDYNVSTQQASPAYSLGLSHGDITDSGKFGYYGSVNYSYDVDKLSDATLSDPLAEIGSYDDSLETYSLNAYLVAGSQFRYEDEVLSKTILLRDAENRTRVEDFVDREGISNDFFVLEWTERQFFSQQFEGTHAFDFSATTHKLDWGLAYSNTNLYQPDRRTYTYFNDFLILNTLERRWFELDESSIDARLEYLAPVEFSSSISTNFTVGLASSSKDREVEQYRFGWSQGDGAEAGEAVEIEQNLEEVFAYYQFAIDTYQIDPRTTNTDSFNAEEELSAIYFDSSTIIGDNWTVNAGVRQETFDQNITYPDQTSANNELPTSDELLPYLGVTFVPHDSWQFRAVASQTLSYPGIIERSEALLFDPDTQERVVGNSTLITSAIDNFDLRVEYYKSDEESISLAIFAKEITDPIERATIDGSGSATNGYTFRQSDSASLTGIEIDGRINTFDTGEWLGFVSGNISFIESEVELDEVSLRLEGDDADGRELQGQAPVLANLQLGLDHFPTEQKFTLLLNYFDDRINRTNGLPRGAIIEKGRTQLDLTYELLLGESLTIDGKIKNILDATTEFELAGIVVESWKEGVEFSFGAKWEF